MKRPLKILLLLSALPAMLCGCDSSENSEADKYVTLNMVTYEGTSATGVTTMTFQEINDSPLITLTCDWNPDPEIPIGTRLMALYTTDTPTQSGHVNLQQAVRCFGGSLVPSSRPDTVVLNPVWVNSLWRSGQYLNLDAKLQYAVAGNRSVRMVADSASVLTANPVLYLEVNSSPDATAPFASQIYASWDLGSVWSNPDVKQITVKLDNANTNQNVWTLTK